MDKRSEALDGNTAAARVAHACNEVIAIYPITPSSSMGEIADELSAEREENIWGVVPDVVELQSEAGASATIHGALASGALATTFTASQGLLLMIPNMHKIAGELLPTVFHVAARSLACQALSIFGDHSDVMNCRTTGFCMLSSGSVQEVQDLAMIATAASLEASLPFIHFFDGFRTSHEVQKIEILEKDDIREMIDQQAALRHRNRGLSPDHPMISGTSQNPDVYFQGRETVNLYYQRVSEIVERCMKRFEQLTGRSYQPFRYFGADDAERVIVIMGSAGETTKEVVNLLKSRGEKVAVVIVHLYRPFSVEHLANILPTSVKKIAVLDRTKEPGSLGEPLYLDVVAAVDEMLEKGISSFETRPLIIGGRYGLSSKDFSPGMVKAVFDNLAQDDPKDHFTVGIRDDVSHTSLDWDESITEVCGMGYQAMFWGLGSDGTVSANKSTIKIIGEATDKYAQGYFEYDSKKAGNRTTSHVRFSDMPILSTYLCQSVDFVGCHNWSFIEKYDMLRFLKKGGTFLLNSPYGPDEVWDRLPFKVQCQIIEREANFYILDATDLARELYLGVRINTIMQTAFFRLAGIIPMDEASSLIKKNIEAAYGRKGKEILDRNYQAVDRALEGLSKVEYKTKNYCSIIQIPPTVPDDAPDFVKDITAKMISLQGNEIPVSLMPPDGKWPSATSQFEKRNIAIEIPFWRPELCIQCGRCSLVCPHATIRTKAYDPGILEKAPPTFKSVDAKGKAFQGMRYTVQVAPEDCTGCGVCREVCPGKDPEDGERKALYMHDAFELRAEERKNWSFFLDIPEVPQDLFNKGTVKGSQFLRPLFEFSGSCAGCGETPYVKLITQLFGDRMLVANATGCSSIYGGNLPTTPYCKNSDGLGPAWTNSLFEDAAEIGFGFRMTCDHLEHAAREYLATVPYLPNKMKGEILDADQSSDMLVQKQRDRVRELKSLAEKKKDDRMLSLADHLVRKSVWVFGGDGWAYDIGFGGLDHILASGKNVNMLVLDTEVYSNTGGQMSKSTSRGGTAKFAYAGKSMPKKDLGLMFQTYGYVYVAQVALGANPAQAVKAIIEAESFDGPSMVICYSPCIAHGINMTRQLEEQEKAVASGHWLLYRFDPRRAEEGLNPLQIDSKEPSIPVKEYMYSENRYRILKSMDPARAEEMALLAQQDVDRRWNLYKQMSEMDYGWSKKKRG
ncbi:MAG: pyruvate:ferredoxin (flavodoxin) oxidoreductase [Methanomassiliicoccales archaeon]|nr:pyruvate:ferredoxin (flavodoxin) oxidoreductase [Methanomassiliicoccales archaeon]NYT16109.1 pyruvate:ferredoxin (flavodoxin) oxidoreductase [Methanomassiliicoccales archaeon]